MARDRHAEELQAVAPLVVAGAPPTLVAPLTLVANGPRVIGVTSAELLRPQQGKALAVATRLDGSHTLPIAQWFMGRYTGIAIVELSGELPATADVVPLSIGAVNASVNVHGAPAAIVTIGMTANGGFERQFAPVYVDPDDAGGMSDHTLFLASPLEAAHARLPIEGSALFAWLPPDPVLGRPPEVVVFALAYPYRAQIARPRSAPVIAELVGLDDLGKALMLAPPEPDERPELGMVAGEIRDLDDDDPLRGL